MYKKITLLVLSVFLVMILISCKQQDPKEKYLSYIKQSESLKEYKVVYKMEMTALKALGAADLKLGVFKKNDKEKSVVEVSMLGQSTTAYAYKIDGKTLTCSKGGYSISGDKDKITCAKTPDAYGNQFQEFQNYASITSNLKSGDFEVSYAGQSEIIGRKCDNFSINVKNLSRLFNSSSLNGLSYVSNPYSGTQARIEVCIDKKTSIPLLTKIYTKAKSELDDNTAESELIAMTAISLSDSVDDSVFAIPVAFLVLGADCSKSEIVAVIEPYKDYNGEIKVNDLGYSIGAGKIIQNTFASAQKSLQKNKVAILQFDTSKQIDTGKPKFGLSYAGSSYEICVGDDCQSFYCAGSSTKCLKKSADKSACESDKGCIYSDDLCSKFSCSVLKDESNCKSKDCTWQTYGSSQGYCYEKNCGDSKSQSECESSSLGCRWYSDPYGSYCTQATCDDLKTKPNCESSTKLKCEWSAITGPSGEDYSSCAPVSCSSSVNEADCRSRKGCQWLVDQYGAYCANSLED